jgi:hypothetical protein
MPLSNRFDAKGPCWPLLGFTYRFSKAAFGLQFFTGFTAVVWKPGLTLTWMLNIECEVNQCLSNTMRH